MKLTIDNLNGAGEIDYTALLDAGTPPRIVRKLNQSPLCTAWLACQGTGISARAGSKLRLYRDSGALWFSGYLADAPIQSYAGIAMGAPVFRVELSAKGEIAALDHRALTEHVAMGSCTAGQAVMTLTGEANAAFNTSAVQTIAGAGSVTVESGELWSTAAVQVADGARAVITAADLALTMVPVGTAQRTLSDSDPEFCPEALRIAVSAPAANDITVIGETEPAMYWRDCITATGGEKYFYLTETAFNSKTMVLVEDDFCETALDPDKWVNDVATPLTFTQGGVTCAGAVALRFRDRVEVGGLNILEQTGISYVSGEGIAGGLFSGGFGVPYCIAGVIMTGGNICPVINGVMNAPAGQLLANMLYEFRTLVFHPEPIRAGQVYSSSVCNGANARSSQVWVGTTHVVLTMRQIDPTNASTLSGPQVVIYDGTLQNVPAYADYEPLWGQNLSCTLGHARAANYGAVWVQSAAPGRPWRTRVIGDVSAGAECYLTADELYFTSASEPVLNEQLEIFYRTEALACGRVVDLPSAQALANSEDDGTRSMVAHVTWPPPRTSLDCEQAARALLDDLTQAGYSGEYQSWVGSLPQGACDVQPGEEWNIAAPSFGLKCAVIVREVELSFQNLSDEYAQFKLNVASDSAQPFTMHFVRTKHNSLLTVVSSNLQDNVSARPAGLPDARITAWGTTTMTLDTGTSPIAGGGFEVRVEGDWGWGMTTARNLVGRYTSETITLPSTGLTQTLYIRQYDASTPPQYSPYSSVLNLEV
jgi:hypothetical protein